MKKMKKKLPLNKQTVVNLDKNALQELHGGDTAAGSESCLSQVCIVRSCRTCATCPENEEGFAAKW